ncbi:MAG: MotE family protein [Chitinophagales bacterium]
MFILSLVALLVAGMIAVGVLDHFGFLDAGAMVLAQAKRIGPLAPVIRTYELGAKRSQAWEQQQLRLEDRKRLLDLRAAEVAEQAKELERKRQDALEEISALETQKSQLMQALLGAQKWDRVAKVCATLTPAKAAGLLAQLEDPDAVQVLLRLPDKQIGQVLGAMDAKRAGRLLQWLAKQ